MVFILIFHGKQLIGIKKERRNKYIQMKLGDYLQSQPYCNIALLWFEGEQTESRWYGVNDIDKIEQKFLDMEFMECVEEEDCKEIWIR